MSSESLKSLIVTDPDLVDPELDVSGLRTQTDTDPRLLASIADFPGISYDPTQFSYLTDLNELFAYGLPMIDTDSTTTPPDTGAGGGGTGDGGQGTTPTTPDIGGPVNTPEEQRLIDAGIGVQIGPGDPVVAPGEIPVTQDVFDEFNRRPVNTDYRNQQLVNQGIGVRVGDGPVMDPGSGLYTQADLDAFNQTPGSRVTPMDPTQMIPQISTYTPGQTIAGDVYAGGDYSDVAGTLGDPLEKQDFVSEADAADPTFLSKIGLGQFDPAEALVKTAINAAIGKPVTLLIDILKDLLPPQDPRVGALNELYPDRTSAGTISSGLMTGYNPVSGGFLNTITGGEYGEPTTYGLQEAYQDRIDTIENTLKNKYGMTTADIADVRAGAYKGDVDSDLLQRLVDLDEAKAKEKGRLDLFSGDIDERDQMLEDIVLQNKIDEGIQAADDDKGSDMLDTTTGVNPFKDIDTGVGEFDTGTNIVDEVALTGGDTPNIIEDIGIENIQENIDRAIDQNIIDRGGGDDIGTGGLDPDRGQQVDRGSSGAEDNQPVSTTTGPPSTGFQPQSTYDAELEDERDVGGGGNDGGGNGGGGKIVCTMMNESYGFGSFRNKIWMKFHKDLSPEYQRGYHKLFLPLVRIAKKNIIVKKVLEHIAVHSTIDMRQSMRGKTHLLGRIYRKILLPVCYWVGKNG
jgi:hypothetical protein